jgi:TP901 family phage tail tape measure protein
MATLDTILNIKVEGTSQMTQLKTAIDETSQQLKDFKAQGKETGESQAKFNAKVVEAETKLKGLRGELNKQKSDLIKNAKALGDNSKSYDSLTKQNAKLSAEMRKLGDPLGKNKQKFQELSGQIRKNTDQLKNMDAQMGRSQRNVGNYGASIGKMTTLIGGAILVAQQLGRAIGSFVDFEFAIKQVGIISGATAEEMEMLTENAKELGRTTSFTAGEVAELQKELAKLGFDPTEINEMTASILDLSFAFDIDLATASERVGGVLKSFNLDASETTRVTDVLAVAFSNSALDMDKFNTAFPKVGAVANTVGFSLEDVTALMGTLADRSLDASVIGTSLRNIFLKMADSSSPLAQALGDSVQSVDDLIPALQDLQASGIDVTEMLELTDQRSVTAFASLLDGSSTIDELNTKLKEAEGTTAEFGEEMRDTMKGSIDEMASSANGLMLEIVDKLSPAITLLTDGLSLLFSGITLVVENFGKLVIGLGAYKATVFLSAVTTSGFTTALKASTVATVANTAKTWLQTYAQRAWNLAVRMNPLGLLVGVVATGVAVMSDYGDATEETTEEMLEQNEAIEETVVELTEIEKIRERNANKMSKELAQLETYRKSIKDTNLTTRERMNALKEYNKIAGTNISNLQSEADIIKELDESYDNVVASIRRKIIVEGSQEEIAQKIKEQNDEYDERVEIDKELVEGKKKLIEINKTLEAEEKKRVEAGLRTNEELVENEAYLQNELADIRTDVEKQRQEEQLEFLEWEESFGMDNAGWHDQQIERYKEKAEAERFFLDNNHDTKLMIAQEEKEQALETLTETENQILANNDLLLSNEEIFNLMRQQRELDEEFGQYSEIQLENNVLVDRYQQLQEDINDILKKRDTMLDELIGGETTFGEAQEKTIDSLKIYKDSLKELELELKNLIVAQEAEKNAFINSEEAKGMTQEEISNGIAKIEEKNSKAIETATEAVIESKKELNAIEEKVAETFDQFDKKAKKIPKTLQEIHDEGQEKIDQDKKLMDSMDEMALVNEEVARRQIELALQVAKAELDLFLQTIGLYDGKAEANNEYINGLLENIALFEEQLDNMGGEGKKTGFLESTLFGKDEDGMGVTGEQFMEFINVTLDNVSNTLGAFNDLQNERLETRLGIIEADKDTEVAKFEESAEAEEMTAEEKATAILAIEKGFDDQMLELKIAQFDKDQQLARSQAYIGGAQAIMNILSGDATGNIIMDAIIRGIMIGGVIATTATQIATINAQAPPTAELGGVMDDSFFARGGMVHGRSHAQGGEKFAVGGRVAELEGGEAVINKRSTAMFKPMLSKINQAGGGRKFADGGMVFDIDSLSSDLDASANIVSALNAQEVVLVESAVTQSQKTVKNIESRITF